MSEFRRNLQSLCDWTEPRPKMGSFGAEGQSGTPYDLCIIGGGIVGLSVAEDAARRGMKVLLCEANDFGSQTSAGCFRLIHGGMRYLQHLDFQRMFESVSEQSILRRRAPHLVRPISFLLPCYGRGKQGRAFLELGMSIYELLTYSRNADFGAAGKLPRKSFVKAADLLKSFPGISRERLTGAVRIWDCQMTSPDRLNLAVAKTAAKCGANLLNYVSVENLHRDSSGQLWNVLLRDVLGGKESVIQSRTVLNSSGPWAKSLLKKSFGEDVLRDHPQLAETTQSKGFQLVLKKFLPNEAIAVSSQQVDLTSNIRRGKRSYFLVPGRGYTLAGTTDEEFSGEPGEFSVSRKEVERFLTELRAGYQSPEIRIENVFQTFGGVLPAVGLPGGIRILKDDIICDHSDGSTLRLPGVFTVVAVKYTTYRLLADTVVNRLVNFLNTQGRVFGEKGSINSPLVGGEFADWKTQLETLKKNYGFVGDPMQNADPAIVDELFLEYGTETANILSLARERGDRVGQAEVNAARVEYSYRDEMAQTLSDVVFRRTTWGAGALPSGEQLRKIAELSQAHFGWSDAQREEELERVTRDPRFLFARGLGI